MINNPIASCLCFFLRVLAASREPFIRYGVNTPKLASALIDAGSRLVSVLDDMNKVTSVKYPAGAERQSTGGRELAPGILY